MLQKGKEKMQIKIDLDNKEEAARNVKEVQKAINELLEVCNEQKDMLKENADKLQEAHDTLFNVAKARDELTEVLKNVHTLLGSKKDLWKDDVQINELMNVMATFIMSSGTIKHGVTKNEKN